MKNGEKRNERYMRTRTRKHPRSFVLTRRAMSESPLL